MAGMYAKRATYNLGQKIRRMFSDLLEVLFQAASLAVDTVRSFFLIVLAILGPIAFAISVFDGFQNTLTSWIARYVSISLWLPVSDLFGAILTQIQILMLDHDISRMQDPNFIPDGSNTVYSIFLIIGIIGYFFVPTVANWIIQAGGTGAYGQSINRTAGGAGGFVAGTTGAIAGNIGGNAIMGYRRLKNAITPAESKGPEDSYRNLNNPSTN